MQDRNLPYTYPLGPNKNHEILSAFILNTKGRPEPVEKRFPPSRDPCNGGSIVSFEA